MKFPDISELPIIEGLPDVLSGIESAADWPARRTRILETAAYYMYGTLPNNAPKATAQRISVSEAHGGKALIEALRIRYANDSFFDAKLIRPVGDGKFPVVIWLCGERFACPYEEQLIERGYALVGINHQQLYGDKQSAPDWCAPACEAFPEASWGAIMCWGWGIMKTIDCVEALPYLDETRIVATGHSRAGKAALAAGAFDERIAVCAPINSGCGGAGCHRFLGDANTLLQNSVITETVGRITHSCPHWFHPNFAKFGGGI